MPPKPATESDGTLQAAPRPPYDGTGAAAAWPVDTPSDAAPDAPSDEALMDALCANREYALAELMRRWEVPVKSFLRRLGVPASDVEDIAQEAFVRLYLKRAAYRSGSALKPWLLTLAANLGRNRMRWRIRRRESSIDEMFEPTDSAAAPGIALRNSAHTTDDTSPPSPSDLAERKQRRQAVREIVSALPGKLREAVVCVDLEGLSHAEAAQVLDCTPKAVENRLRRARERIRNHCIYWLGEGKL